METFKKIVGYVVFPILFVCGVIYYLLNKIRDLQMALNQSKADKELAATLAKRDEAHKDAQDAEKYYRELLDKYNRDNGGNGGQA